jgi:hypothetical protein
VSILDLKAKIRLYFRFTFLFSVFSPKVNEFDSYDNLVVFQQQ